MYFEAGYRARNYNVTIWLIIINIIMYIIESIWAGNFINLRGSEPVLILGQVNAFVIYRHWLWQLFTSMFIHFDLLHIGLNMFWLLILGSQYERLFGGWSLVATYILTGLAGNLLTLYVSSPLTNSAGASGAVFGIFGALIITQAFLGGNLATTLVYGFFILFLNSIGPGINFVAHGGGFLVGLIIGYLNVQRLRRYYIKVRYGSPYTY